MQLKAIAALVVLALTLPLLPGGGAPAEVAAAAPGATPSKTPASSRNASMTVAVAKAAPSVAPTGTMSLTVAVTLSAPVDTLSVRLQFRRSSGRLVYQKTQEVYNLKAGTTQVTFTRPLADLELKEGRYPVEVHVAADRLPPLTLSDRVYVLRPGREPVPVAVVARLDYTPMIGPDGKFAVDPATSTVTRDEVASLGSLMVRDPWLRMSVGFPPLLIEEWQRMRAGYSLAESGTPSVPKDAPIAATYASALASLGRATQDGRLEVLDVPFADPDLAGLRSIGTIGDLQMHYDRGFSLYASAGTTPAAGTAVMGDSIAANMLPILAHERIDRVLLRPSALSVSKNATAAPGVYTIADTGVRALVIDERATQLLGDERAKTDALIDYLFERMAAGKGEQPVVVNVRVGQDAKIDIPGIEARLTELARTGWVRFETTAEAASHKPSARGRLFQAAYPGRPAPTDYWAAATRGRRYAQALVDAVSLRDDDAAGSLYAAMLSESRLWAGQDGRWASADRGLAFAEAAQRVSRRTLDKVTVATETITLSGATGKVPLSIRNGSNKTLAVNIVTSAANTRFPGGRSVRTVLRPSDNYITVPVDLGAGGVYDRITVSVVSGKIVMASTTVDVHASYLDRLALIATVVVVLGILLFYIRRKSRPPAADK